MCDDVSERLIEMIKGFSDEYLNEEYRELNIKLALRLIESDFPLGKGRLENWASAIILAVGQLNFLFEYPTKPYITQDFLCSYFGSKRLSITVKARDIRRHLKLKLDDEEFSTGLVLMMNIPESDDDLKRIRQLDEVKFLISQTLPGDVFDVENNELNELIHDSKINDEIYSLLRSPYIICFYSGIRMLKVDEGNGKYLIPLSTSIDECSLILSNLEDVEPKTWPLVNVINYMSSESFHAVVLNPEVDNFIILKEMLAKILC